MTKKDQPARADNAYSGNNLNDLLDSLSSRSGAAVQSQKSEPAPPKLPEIDREALTDPEPLHDGHRERLRQKFRETMSFKGLSDHEILELLLFYTIARTDTNELAHWLIKKFGSFEGVLNAPYEELTACRGLSEQSALYLKILMRLCAKYNVEMQQRVLVSNSESLEDYMIYQFSGESQECAKLYLVDKQSRLSAPYDIGRGLESKSVFNFKKAMNIIVNASASYIILAHNHISGSASPSENDVIITRRFRQMIEPIGVLLIDHFVVCGGELCSMRASGLLDI